jgi:hypothetical protein
MSEGQSVQVKHRPLHCKHCGQGRFVHRTAKLNFFEFLDLGLGWQSADVYVCTHCGFLHWFLEPQTEQQIQAEAQAEDDLTGATECLACHKSIPAGTAKCPSGCIPVFASAALSESDAQARARSKPLLARRARNIRSAASRNGNAPCPSCGWSYA